MTPVQAQRCLLLADHIEQNVTDDEWDMKTWWCGTVGCAAGHAANMPEFQAQGLFLDRNDEPRVAGRTGPRGTCLEFFGVLTPFETHSYNMHDSDDYGEHGILRSAVARELRKAANGTTEG